MREPALLAAAVRDVRSVYYLVHAMADRDYERLDRLAAQAVARAAGEADVDRIVYLSGLIPADRGRLSQHLRSRLEVEERPRGHRWARGRLVCRTAAAFHCRGGSAARIPLPLVPTAMAARVAPLFSDVPSSLVQALMLSLQHDLVCAPDSPMGRLLPSGYRLLGVRDAIRAALHESPRLVGAAAPLPGDPAWAWRNASPTP